MYFYSMQHLKPYIKKGYNTDNAWHLSYIQCLRTVQTVQELAGKRPWEKTRAKINLLLFPWTVHLKL